MPIKYQETPGQKCDSGPSAQVYPPIQEQLKWKKNSNYKFKLYFQLTKQVNFEKEKFVLIPKENLEIATELTKKALAFQPTDTKPHNSDDENLSKNLEILIANFRKKVAADMKKMVSQYKF